MGLCALIWTLCFNNVFQAKPFNIHLLSTPISLLSFYTKTSLKSWLNPLFLLHFIPFYFEPTPIWICPHNFTENCSLQVWGFTCPNPIVNFSALTLLNLPAVCVTLTASVNNCMELNSASNLYKPGSGFSSRVLQIRIQAIQHLDFGLVRP